MATGGIRNEIARRFHAFFCHASWNIGVVREPIHVFLEHDAKPEVSWFRPIHKGSYLADPFGIVKDGKIHVFCEAFDYGSYKGVIAHIELSDEGFISSPQPALDGPFHLSYPYVLEWNGHTYCIPESYQAREISLYKADSFPTRWAKIATLVPDFAGVDPTLFYHQGKWWMMCTSQDEGPNDTLFIWHSAELHGPWRPHAANPIRIGRNGARPAGTPFVHRGALYRPAMDSTKTYGRRIVILQITDLTPTEFREEAVSLVEPFGGSPFRDGVHTLSAVGDLTLVDGLRFTFERTEFKMELERERAEVIGKLCGMGHKH